MPAQPSATSSLAADRANAVQALEALAGELATRGWTARAHAPAGRLPSLYVQNPEPGAAVLCEHIYASPCQDGAWWYWWSWADKIALIADPGGAAAAITRGLRAATDAGHAR